MKPETSTFKINRETPIGPQIQTLLQELAKFPKGARATQQAKRIRRNLRELGYRISDQATHHLRDSKKSLKELNPTT